MPRFHWLYYFACSEYAYTWRVKSSLRNHVKPHFNESFIISQTINQSVSYVSLYEQNTKYNHVLRIISLYSFACAICEYLCKVKSLLGRHSLTHSDELEHLQIINKQVYSSSLYDQIANIYSMLKPVIQYIACINCEYTYNVHIIPRMRNDVNTHSNESSIVYLLNMLFGCTFSYMYTYIK